MQPRDPTEPNRARLHRAASANFSKHRQVLVGVSFADYWNYVRSTARSSGLHLDATDATGGAIAGILAQVTSDLSN